MDLFAIELIIIECFVFSVKSERHIVIHDGRTLLFQIQLTGFNENQRDKEKEKRTARLRRQKSFDFL